VTRIRKYLVGLSAAGIVFAIPLPAVAAAGHLDGTFSGDGKLVLAPSTHADEAHDVVIQPDHKILVLVNVDQSGSHQRFGVFRLLPNGKLDTTFSGDGKILFGFGPSTSAWANAMALTPTGRIVVGGTTSAQGGGYALARLTPDGQLDPGFGTGGKAVIQQVGGWIFGLAVQPDGRIVFVGRDGISCCGVVGRVTKAGKLDTGFGGGGTQDVTWGRSDANLFAVLIRKNGTILVAGGAGGATPQSNDVGLAQLTPSGGFDNNNFNPPFGELTTDFGAAEGADAIGLQNGKIVVAGSRFANSTSRALLARYSSTGTLDTTFGSGGHVFADVGNGSANDLAVAGDGKLVVVGPWRTSSTAGGFFLMRRRPKGAADPGFGASGIAKPHGTYDGSPAVAIQADGRIVVAEATNGIGEPKDAFVARYLAA
jgi:uncharacterized delta-60 repeat protein